MGRLERLAGVGWEEFFVCKCLFLVVGNCCKCLFCVVGIDVSRYFWGGVVTVG